MIGEVFVRPPFSLDCFLLSSDIGIFEDSRRLECWLRHYHSGSEVPWGGEAQAALERFAVSDGLKTCWNRYMLEKLRS